MSQPSNDSYEVTVGGKRYGEYVSRFGWKLGGTGLR